MLQDEIKEAQRLVKTDSYQMSIGEIVNMYKEGELIINPDFQRLYRWEIGQKSKLIESLLLGIPLPPIFVFETEKSTWELVDGLQRLSTIFEFMGLLKNIQSSDDQNQFVIPTALEGTKYLPSLKNAVWERKSEILDVPVNEQKELNKELQLAVKRSRIGVEILKKPSDNKTKFDLFQRLNSGGTALNAQELRNCIIIMTNKNFHSSMIALAEKNYFLETCGISLEQKDKQKHMEYLSRFLVLTFKDYNSTLDVEEYIDEGIIALAETGMTTAIENTFNKTFEILHTLYGENAFKRLIDGQHKGRTTLAAFECIAVGIAKNLEQILSKSNKEEFIRQKVTEFWQQEDIRQFFSPGIRGTTRIQKTIPFGAAWFRA